MNLNILSLFVLTIPFSLFFSGCDRRDAARQVGPNGEASSENHTAATQRSATGSGLVYTADERGNSISVINIASGQVRKVPISVAPHNVQISNDGRWLLVVGAPATGGGHSHGEKDGKHDEAGGHRASPGKVLIFDTGEMDSGEDPAAVEVGRHPAHVVIDPQGKFIYATNSEDDTVSVIDAAQKRQVKTIATGKFPHGLRMSPDGREIYTANVNDGTVSVISTAEQKEVARVPVGKSPVQVGFTPDGKRVYVSLRDENAVTVIDTAARRKISSVPVGSQPIQMFATPDGRFVYVANQGTESSPGNTVSVIDAGSNQVAATITVGKGAHGVVASSDGSRIFITCTFDDTVSVIDTATQKVVNTFRVGDAPNGITYKSAI